MGAMYYPIFLDLKGRPCVVVGGGAVAERKVMALLDCGAVVKVISPEIIGALQRQVEGATMEYVPRRYRAGDLRGSLLVIAASDDSEVNAAVWEEASRLEILANVADCPEKCNFILPSVLRRGGLAVAVGTGGASPALARRIRTDLERLIGPEYEDFVRVMELLRKLAMRSEKDPGRRRELLKSAASGEAILERLRAGETPEAILETIASELNLNPEGTGD